MQHNTWSKVESINKLPTPRSGHCCAMVDQFYIFGGLTQVEALNDLQSLNLQDYKWTKIQCNQSPSPRGSSQMCGSVEQQKLYLFGGTSFIVEKTCKNDLYQFDIGTSEWSIMSSTSQAPSERYGHSMVLHNNQLYVFGGVKFTKAANRMNPEFLNDYWTYSILTKQWIRLELSGQLPSARYRHSSLFVNSQMYIIGGTTNQNRFGQIVKADLETMSWHYLELEATKNKIKKNLFKGRFGHASINIDNIIYIYGGYDDGLCEDALQLDVLHNQWSRKKFSGVSINARDFFGFAYTANQLIIFGGKSIQNQRLNDTYIWNFTLKSDEQYYCSLRTEIHAMLQNQDNCSNILIKSNNKQYCLHSSILSVRCPKLNSATTIFPFSEQLMKLLINYIYKAQIDYTVLQSIQFRESIELCIFIDDIELTGYIITYFLSNAINSGDYEFIQQSLNTLVQTNNNNTTKYINDIIPLLALRQKVINQLSNVIVKDTKSQSQQLQQLQLQLQLYNSSIQLFSDVQQKIINKYYQNMKQLRNSNDTTDIILISGGIQYRTHSCVLVARCEFFKALIRFEEGQVQQIILEDIPQNVINSILDYLYKGYQGIQRSATQNLDTLIQMFRVSNYFMLTNQTFMFLLQEGMAQYITLTDLHNIVEMAELLNAQYLLHECCIYISDNLKQIKNLDQYSKDVVVKVLQIIADKQ